MGLLEGKTVLVAGGSTAATRSFSRTWANELKTRGIRVNAITPGPIDAPAPDRFKQRSATRVPLERRNHP